MSKDNNLENILTSDKRLIALKAKIKFITGKKLTEEETELLNIYNKQNKNLSNSEKQNKINALKNRLNEIKSQNKD